MLIATPPPQHRPGVMCLDSDTEEERSARASRRQPPRGSESLARAVSSLDLSGDRADTEVSPGDMIPSGARGCCAGWSPASVEGQPQSQRRQSKRRSISDLSPSARMTPESLQARGLGIPWQKPAAGICGMFDVQLDELEQARNFCLLPSPELHKRPAPKSDLASPRGSSSGMRCSWGSTASPDPGNEGPSQLQRRFLEGLRRATAATTPEEKERKKAMDQEGFGDVVFSCDAEKRSPVFTPSSTRSPSPRPFGATTSSSSSVTGPPPSWLPGERRQSEVSRARLSQRRRSSIVAPPPSWGCKLKEPSASPSPQPATKPVKAKRPRGAARTGRPRRAGRRVRLRISKPGAAQSQRYVVSRLAIFANERTRSESC